VEYRPGEANSVKKIYTGALCMTLKLVDFEENNANS
jgi:hypothetical protein